MSKYDELGDLDLLDLSWERLSLPKEKKPYYLDDNAARLVRDRIAELGLQDAFCRAMNTILVPTREEQSNPELSFYFTWSQYQATPRQQAIAALEAREQEGK